MNSSGTTKGNIFYDSDDNFMVFKTDGTASSNERLRITSAGEILINEGNARTYVDGNNITQTPKLQVEADDNNSSSIALR